MKFFAFLASSFLLGQAYAGPAWLPDLPAGKKVLCEKSLLEKINSEFSSVTPKWSREVDTNSVTSTFRASRDIGEWYELQISDIDAPKLIYLSDKKTKDFVWDSKTCKFETVEGAGLVLFKQDKKHPVDSFTDADLKKILAKKSNKGIIYVWSPRMVYSVTEFRMFRDVAKKKKIEFTAVLDPVVDVKEAAAAAKKVHADFRGRKMASVDLYMRNATLHFPTVYVYANGKVNSHRLIGVLPAAGLSMSIDKWMEELK